MSGPRTVAFFGSDNLLPAQKRVLRPSGGSEGMFSSVILKPHQSVVCVLRTLLEHLADELGLNSFQSSLDPIDPAVAAELDHLAPLTIG
jgi:hypothetical protein